MAGNSQDEVLEIPLDDHVLHGAHCDFQEVCVGGVGEVAVDLLVGVAVEGAELVHEVFADLLRVVGRADVVGEAVGRDGAVRQLFAEQVHLVQEEDERRL